MGGGYSDFLSFFSNDGFLAFSIGGAWRRRFTASSKDISLRSGSSGSLIFFVFFFVNEFLCKSGACLQYPLRQHPDDRHRLSVDDHTGNQIQQDSGEDDFSYGADIHPSYHV
jgi:hypothetical protein